MRAIQVSEFGGPEVLEVVQLDDPAPREGQLLVEVEAAGINYADTHQAENSYLSAQKLPLVPGTEVVGRTADGRRVAALTQGGYAEKALVAEGSAFDVPDEVEPGAALALLVQGLTAWHLLRTSVRMAEGESVVVHAAAGGVGTVAVQLAKAWGAGRVIGVASSEEKRALATELGADATVDAGADDLKAALQEANGGEKVDLVLEMVGGATFDASLAALAPFGRLVHFGMASREAPTPVEPGRLMTKSAAVVGFWLMHCFADPRRMLAEPLAELFGMVADGRLRPIVGGTYALADARKAHEDLRARTTTGKLVLDPRA